VDTGEQWFTPEKQALYDLLRDVNAQLGGDDTAAAILSELSTRVRELAEAATEPAPLAPAPSFLAAVLADVEKRVAHFEQTGSTIMGHATGFPRLDKLMGGLEPGRVTILEAAPGAGKTTLSNQLAYFVAAHAGAPVLYVSFENHPEDLTLKTLCRLAGVSVSQASKGLIQPSVLGEAARTFQARAGSLYLQAGNRATTLEAIRGTLATMRRTHPDAGHPVLFLDYLQQLAKAATGPGRGGDLFSQVTRISGQLSTLANETGATIWAISSLSRDGYKGGSKEGMGYSKGSGDIEFDAAHMLRLSTDEKNATPDSNTDCLHLALIKNRYGAVGGMSLARDRTTLRIAEVDHRGPNLSTGLGDRVRSNGGR